MGKEGMMSLDDRYNEMLKIDFDVFKNDWDKLNLFLNKIDNPEFIILNDLMLYDDVFMKFPNLIKVDGNIRIMSASVSSLNNLEYVGGNLDLMGSNVNDLGNVFFVGGDLKLPLRLGYLSEEDVKSKIIVVGSIFYE